MTTTEGGDTQMINNSTLSGSMSVAELVPKAATTAPAARGGDGAFGEALAGAHTVHDRRESREAAGMRRDQEPADRTRGLGQTREVRDERADGSDRSVEAPASSDDAGATTDVDRSEGATVSEASERANDVDTTDTTDTNVVATPTGSDATTTGDAGATAQVTVAVAAVPVVAAAPAVADLDAIIVPTGATAQVQVDAVDAAVRLAIAADAPIEADATEAAATPTTVTTATNATTATTATTVTTATTAVTATAATTAATTAVTAATAATTTATAATEATTAATEATTAATAATEATTAATEATTAATAATTTAVSTTSDADAQLALMPAPGTEDAADGDVQAGPMRPSTSMPTTTSGPSPVQLAAATFAADDTEAIAEQQATTPAIATRIASTEAVQVAAGEGGDAATQLVQAVAVEADAETTEADPATVAATTVKKSEAATTAPASDEPTVVVDADVDPNAAARPGVQTPGAAVALAAQQQAQAKAAEQAADDGAESGSPKLEPLPVQAAATATIARTEGGIRAGAGQLTAQVQERIDHIAEQLATRLRLSQAAGGSQVQLSLKPRELGEVTVQMNVREGVVAATILVDKADTMRTMQSNIEDLKRSLEQQGLSIQQFSVDVRGEAGAGGANARAAAELRAAAARAGQGVSSTVAGAAAVIPGLSGDRTVTAEEAHDGDVSVLA
jgi:flagellar hook-length control protein FliK